MVEEDAAAEGAMAAIAEATASFPLAAPEADRPGYRKETAERILDGAARAIASCGARCTSMESVAKEAGVTRMTVYRYFASRDELMRAITEREILRYYGQLLGRARAIETGAGPADNPVREILVESIRFSIRYWSEHPVVNALLTNDPEQILPQLTTKADVVLGNVIAAQVPVFDRWRAKGWVAPHRSEWVAEWMARLVISWLIQPSPHIDVHDPDVIRRLIDSFVWPVLDPSSAILSPHDG